MLSINFDDLRKRHSAFIEAFNILEDWWEANNRRIRHFEPVGIASWRPEIDSFELSAALNVLVHDGVLKRAYTVRAPEGTLAVEGSFASPSEIPGTLHGTGDDEFQKVDGDIIPVYEEVIAS